MALPAEIEVLIPMFVACFFALLYEFDKEENLWSGIISAFTWLITGMVFLITSAYPVIALVFMGIGIIYIIRIMMALYKPLTERRRLEGDTS
jgi:hypothetical protein